MCLYIHLIPTKCRFKYCLGDLSKVGGPAVLGCLGLFLFLALQVPCLQKLSVLSNLAWLAMLEGLKISEGCILYIFEEEDYLFKLLIEIITAIIVDIIIFPYIIILWSSLYPLPLQYKPSASSFLWESLYINNAHQTLVLLTSICSFLPSGPKTFDVRHEWMTCFDQWTMSSNDVHLFRTEMYKNHYAIHHLFCSGCWWFLSQIPFAGWYTCPQLLWELWF